MLEFWDDMCWGQEEVEGRNCRTNSFIFNDRPIAEAKHPGAFISFLFGTTREGNTNESRCSCPVLLFLSFNRLFLVVNIFLLFACLSFSLFLFLDSCLDGFDRSHKGLLSFRTSFLCFLVLLFDRLSENSLQKTKALHLPLPPFCFLCIFFSFLEEIFP